jgi:hypothetical protein
MAHERLLAIDEQLLDGQSAMRALFGQQRSKYFARSIRSS